MSESQHLLQSALRDQDFHAIWIWTQASPPMAGTRLLLRHFTSILLDAPNMASVHDDDSLEAGFMAMERWLSLSQPKAGDIDGLLEEAESFLSQETGEGTRLNKHAAAGVHRFLSLLCKHGLQPEDTTDAFTKCLAFPDVRDWHLQHRAQTLNETLPSSLAGTVRARF